MHNSQKPPTTQMPLKGGAFHAPMCTCHGTPRSKWTGVDTHSNLCSHAQGGKPIPKGCVLWDSTLHDCRDDNTAEMESRSVAAREGSWGQGEVCV